MPKVESRKVLDLVVPWPDGKPMHQLDELGVMYSTRELRLVVRDLQERVAALEGK